MEIIKILAEFITTMVWWIQIRLKYRVKINVLSPFIYNLKSDNLFNSIIWYRSEASRIIIKIKQLVAYYFYSLLLCSRHERGNLRSGFPVQYKLKLTYLELWVYMTPILHFKLRRGMLTFICRLLERWRKKVNINITCLKCMNNN